MSGSQRRKDNNAGSTMVWPVDPRSRHLQLNVAETLPTLVAKSKHWSRKTICPKCGGLKSKQAQICRVCWDRIKRSAYEARRRNLVNAPRVNQENWPKHQAFWRHAGDGGGLRPQPDRERRIMGPDRVWRTEEEDRQYWRWAAARAVVDALFSDEGTDDGQATEG